MSFFRYQAILYKYRNEFHFLDVIDVYTLANRSQTKFSLKDFMFSLWVILQHLHIDKTNKNITRFNHETRLYYFDAL